MKNIDHLFIEQAEYLNEGDFVNWSIDHPSFNTHYAKLSGPGAKLITGPRGSGKTTILRKAIAKINLSEKKCAVYINFKKSLSLEPFYRNNLNPSVCFTQWLLAKTLIAILEFDKKLDTSRLLIHARKIVSQLEAGSDLDSGTARLTYDDVFKSTEQLLTYLEKDRLIVFMDDAAHAFSPEQQRDFFDFFRSIKNRILSPKAAIYPGVTVFSPAFQVGHDAEQVDIWVNPVDENYVDFLIGLLERRLPEDEFKRIRKNEGMLELLAYCSFGIPRNFLNLIRDIYDSNTGKTISSASVFEAISKSCKRSDELFSSLKVKLARYSNYVGTGQKVLSSSVNEIKKYNREKEVRRQSVTLALKVPVDENLKRVIGFLEYSGLVFPLEKTVSRGVKGTFELYYISLAHLVDSNAIVGAKGKKIGTFVEALNSLHAHEFTRVSLDTLLSTVDNKAIAFQLALSPCAKCATPRINETSKFCHSCGSPLTEASVFYELIDKDISVLPLTSLRVQRIKENSSLKTVKDVLNDIDHKKLRSVPNVGEFWAKRIYEYAEEYIS